MVVNFKLGDIKHERGTEKSESSTGIEPKTSRTPGGRSIYWATRIHKKRGHSTEFLYDMSWHGKGLGGRGGGGGCKHF